MPRLGENFITKINNMRFILLTLFFTALLQISQAQTELPITLNDYGFIFVEAEFNGEKGTFILDTGAGSHMLSGKFFAKIEAAAQPAGIFTGFRHNGERIDAEMYMIPELTLGGFRQNVPLLGVYPPLDEYGIDGIISLKLFENQAFTIDFKNKKLILENSNSLSKIEREGDYIPIEFQQYRDKALDIFMEICINGVALQAEFDTGSGYNTLMINPFYMEQMGVKKEDCKETFQDAEKTKRDWYATLPAGSVCAAPIAGAKEVSVNFREGLIYEALIGSGWFKDKALTIDIPNKRMLVR